MRRPFKRHQDSPDLRIQRLGARSPTMRPAPLCPSSQHLDLLVQPLAPRVRARKELNRPPELKPRKTSRHLPSTVACLWRLRPRPTHPLRARKQCFRMKTSQLSNLLSLRLGPQHLRRRRPPLSRLRWWRRRFKLRLRSLLQHLLQMSLPPSLHLHQRSRGRLTEKLCRVF